MKYYTIYLMGQMSTDAATWQWRAAVREKLANKKHFVVIDPCASEYNETAKGLDKDSEAIIVPKDRNYVKKSDITIVNFNHFTPDKPFVGTLFELAWCYDDPSKVVIGIFDGDPQKDYLCSHPFVYRSVHAWVKNEEKACKLITAYTDLQ